MKKLLTPIVAILFLTSCDKNENFQPKINYEFSIDSVLTRDGSRSLTKDQNGFYHLKITVNGFSQSHRVVGKILANGNEPYPPEKISFESNLFWWLKQGDTLATITQAYVNYFTGQYTIVNLPPMIANKDELVPTTNCCSYSGKGGEINNVIAPIREMIGDTLLLKAYHSKSNKTIFTKIVLE
ncbi:hypothetical protein EB155_05200 [archaeon]|jgi:hypothetical protein|nr:hypothetical protein [archaeon]NDB79244.1 hypothetical protein [archaeon]